MKEELEKLDIVPSFPRSSSSYSSGSDSSFTDRGRCNTKRDKSWEMSNEHIKLTLEHENCPNKMGPITDNKGTYNIIENIENIGYMKTPKELVIRVTEEIGPIIEQGMWDVLERIGYLQRCKNKQLEELSQQPITIGGVCKAKNLVHIPSILNSYHEDDLHNSLLGVMRNIHVGEGSKAMVRAVYDDNRRSLKANHPHHILWNHSTPPNFYDQELLKAQQTGHIGTNASVVEEDLTIHGVLGAQMGENIILYVRYKYDFPVHNPLLLMGARYHFLAKKNKILHFLKHKIRNNQKRRIQNLNKYRRECRIWEEKSGKRRRAWENEVPIERKNSESFSILSGERRKRGVRQQLTENLIDKSLPIRTNEYTDTPVTIELNNKPIFDPCRVHYIYKRSQIWSSQEIETFLEKYLMHPKDFIAIAAYFTKKTVGDLVEFYYNFKYPFGLYDLEFECLELRKEKRMSWIRKTVKLLMTKLNYLRMISVGGSKGGGQVSGHYWTTDDLLRYFKSRNRRHRAAPDYNKSNELSFYLQQMEEEQKDKIVTPLNINYSFFKTMYEKGRDFKWDNGSKLEFLTPLKRKQSDLLSMQDTFDNQIIANNLANNKNIKSKVMKIIETEEENKGKKIMEIITTKEKEIEKKMQPIVRKQALNEGNLNIKNISKTTKAEESNTSESSKNDKYENIKEEKKYPKIPGRVGKKNIAKWEEIDKNKFVELLKKYDKDWKLIANHFPDKSENQIKNFYQNSKYKLNLKKYLGTVQSGYN